MAVGASKIAGRLLQRYLGGSAKGENSNPAKKPEELNLEILAHQENIPFSISQQSYYVSPSNLVAGGEGADDEPTLKVEARDLAKKESKKAVSEDQVHAESANVKLAEQSIKNPQKPGLEQHLPKDQTQNKSSSGGREADPVQKMSDMLSDALNEVIVRAPKQRRPSNKKGVPEKKVQVSHRAPSDIAEDLLGSLDGSNKADVSIIQRLVKVARSFRQSVKGNSSQQTGDEQLTYDSLVRLVHNVWSRSGTGRGPLVGRGAPIMEGLYVLNPSIAEGLIKLLAQLRPAGIFTSDKRYARLFRFREIMSGARHNHITEELRDEQGESAHFRPAPPVERQSIEIAVCYHGLQHDRGDSDGERGGGDDRSETAVKRYSLDPGNSMVTGGMKLYCFIA